MGAKPVHLPEAVANKMQEWLSETLKSIGIFPAMLLILVLKFPMRPENIFMFGWKRRSAIWPA